MDVRQRSRSARLVWAPSRLRRVVRNRWVQLAAVIAAASTLMMTGAAQAAQVEEAKASWGENQPVLVVTKAVAAGDLVAASVEVRNLPVAMVPDGAIGQVASDQRARTPLFAGEVLLGQRVTGERTGSPPAGTAALTVGVATQPPSLEAGDVVDVWSVDARDLSSDQVMHNVIVLDFSDQTVTVAVPTSQLRRATAAALRPLIVTVTG
jgi:hypothetical protein